ncbi:nitroreductase family protein [candidate division KSB1 bacterium]
MSKKMNIGDFRTPDYTIDEIFINRWSARAMSGESISDEELMPLFDAARWAPSAFNAQPWRFIYAHRDTRHWDKLFNVLADFNKQWVKNAAVLILILSKKIFDHNGKPSRTHSFDTGAAWVNLALQGTAKGLVVHCMSGFDYEKAYFDLTIPDEYNVEAMCAVGRPGRPEDLPPDMREREKPSGRNDISDFVFEGNIHK